MKKNIKTGKKGIMIFLAVLAVMVFIIEVILTLIDRSRDFTMGAVTVLSLATAAIVMNTKKIKYIPFKQLTVKKKVIRATILTVLTTALLAGLSTAYLNLI